MNAFFDTNVIIYAYDARSGAKQARANGLIEKHATDRSMTVSTQVLAECYTNLVRKGLLDAAHALHVVDGLCAGRVVAADADSVRRGLTLSQRYRLSSWDGLIVQAALDAGCTTLFTEDLQAGQRFGDLEVVNPFVDAAHEAGPPWPAPKVARPRARAPTAKRAAKW